MNPEDDRIGNPKTLRATIGTITRGGPFVVNVYQDTKPVLLKDMPLPAEARYIFRDPTDHSANFVNHPISIEFFFGENGKENFDISLGKFQLHEFLPPFTGPRDIELRLAVSSDQILSISLLDPVAQKYRSLGFIDISTLEHPLLNLSPKGVESESIKKTYQFLLEMVEKPQPRQTGKPRRGKDLDQDTTISFDGAVHGGNQDIEVPSTQTCAACLGSGSAPGWTLSPCQNCTGTGWAKVAKKTSASPEYHFTVCTTCQGDGLVNPHPCQVCQGHGWVRIKRPIALHIPACIDSGTVIILPHQGEPGQFGGLPGHLRITVIVATHAFLTRTGRDILIDLPVSASFARHGGRVRVPALERGVANLLDLPAGTQSNAIFHISEDDAYSLTARVETYQPAFLVMLPNINRRIQAIREWLGGAEIEISGAIRIGLDEKIPTPVIPAPPGSPPGLREDTQQAEFYSRRGLLYADKRDQEHSLADYNLAIKLDPECASAYDRRSAWYMGHQEAEKAFVDINKALELDPNNAEYIYHRGILHHFQKDLAKALADYTKALELDPTKAEVYESRGEVNTLQNDLEAALADFNQALELDPTRVKSYHQRGIVYQHKNDLARAIVDLTRALELDPYNNRIRSDRSNLYVQRKELENALADASKLAQEFPGNATVFNNRGFIHYLLSDFAKARADYDNALTLDPKLVPAYYYRGRTCLSQGQYEQAIDDFNQSLLLHPGDAWVYLGMAQAYRGLGKQKKATVYCQKAVDASQDPKLCQEVQKLLIDMYKH